MSAFKVQKVTKVKGLTDLSSKVQSVETKDPSTRRTRNSVGGSERPQVKAAGKGTSSKSELKNSPGNPKKSSNVGTVGQESSGSSVPPRPTTRSKPAPARRLKDSSNKNCPVQNGRSEPVKEDETSKQRSVPTKPTPRPRAGPPVPKSSASKNAEKTKQVTGRPKPPVPVKKESSYDASDSDLDGSRDNLVGEGDFGYETGSLDDSDLSGDLLSPAAQDEHKQIANESNSQPLHIANEQEITSAQIQKPQEHGTTTVRQSMSYTYAGDEFRPLIVTNEGGIAAPVKPRLSDGDKKQPPNSYDMVETVISSDIPARKPRRPQLTQYEEVEIVDGEYDRSNVAKFSAAMDLCTSPSPISVQGSNDYSTVGEVDLMTHRQVTDNSYSEVQEISLSFDDSTKQTQSNEPEAVNPADLYAVVQKKTKASPKAKKPELPKKPVGRHADAYETITDGLKSMIDACHDVDSAELADSGLHDQGRESDTGHKPALPPRIPKPYSGPGPDIQTTKKKSIPQESQGLVLQNESDQEEDSEQAALYAIVQKKPKSNSREHSSMENLQSTEQRASETEDSGGTPPPLPYRPNFSDEGLKKSRSSEDILQSESQPENLRKGGFGIFKKHRRNRSHDMGIPHYDSSREKAKLSPTDKSVGYSDGFQRPKQQRSKSQGDIMKGLDEQDFVEVTISPINKDRSTTVESDQVPIKAYLEVDIIDPPPTLDHLKYDPLLDMELPEGWREVRNENGTYFWHVPTGTTQWERPQMVVRQKRTPDEDSRTVQERPERQKVLSFPVHSMGWEELEEGQVAPHNMSDTVAACISSLASKRNDLWSTAETWGEGKDIRLLLEGETLKLVEPRHKVALLVQPVSKMRVWGVGKEDHRDFAYVARDPNTGKHKCHMFRCHGNISGRAITNALHEMCNRILEEKKRAKHEAKKKSADKQSWSDIINTPPPPSVKEMTSFNEKPFLEQKKSYTARYVGNMEVSSPTGIEVLQKAISKVSSKGGAWSTCLVEVTISSIKITDCVKHEIITEDRVRFLSFLGVGKDEKFCGYIVTSNPDSHLCHVFQCAPHAATLTKALEEACKLRYQKCLDAHPEASQRLQQHVESERQNRDKERDKSGFITSVHGLLGKLGPKKGGKKEESSSGESKTGQSVLVATSTHTFMVKYYGALPVAIGTGIETVQEAAKHLAGGTLLICQLDVAINGLTLFDSQRSHLSRRHIDADTISYCGLTSTRTHFGLIQSQGGGRYICHVFAEYKTKAGPIVAAIHETL